MQYSIPDEVTDLLTKNEDNPLLLRSICIIDEILSTRDNTDEVVVRIDLCRRLFDDLDIYNRYLSDAITIIRYSGYHKVRYDEDRDSLFIIINPDSQLGVIL